MCSVVLGSVNALTTSHEEIHTNMNQDLPSIESSQISSISNAEHMSKLITQFKIEIHKLKQPMNKTNNN